MAEKGIPWSSKRFFRFLEKPETPTLSERASLSRSLKKLQKDKLVARHPDNGRTTHAKLTDLGMRSIKDRKKEARLRANKNRDYARGRWTSK